MTDVKRPSATPEPTLVSSSLRGILSILILGTPIILGAGAIVRASDAWSFAPLLRGGGQEKRQRGGTENVAGVVWRDDQDVIRPVANPLSPTGGVVDRSGREAWAPDLDIDAGRTRRRVTPSNAGRTTGRLLPACAA